MADLHDIAMREEPDEVDLARLKEAIRTGEYRPNVEELADRMLWDAQCVDDILSS